MRTASRGLLLLSSIAFTGCHLGLKDSRSPFADSSTPRPMAEELSKDDHRSLLLLTARGLAETGHASDATEMYLKAERLGTPSETLDAALAPLYATLGNYPEALARYRRLTQADANDLMLKNNFAWTLMEAGQFEEAESLFQSILTQDPRNQRAQNNLAILYARNGDREKSLAAFQKSVGLAAAYHNLGVLLIDQDQPELARQAFNDSLRCGTTPSLLTQAFHDQLAVNK